jgi:hypothetical protein
MSQYGNQNGRLRSNDLCHVQRIGNETEESEYNFPKSVQTLFIKYEGLKDMLNSIRKEDFRYSNKEVFQMLCANFDFTRSDLSQLFQAKECTIKRWLHKHKIKLRQKGGQKVYSVDESFFETIDSEEKAYFLGFLISDGCVRKRGNSYNICLKLNNKDLHILEEFKRCLNFNGNLIHNKDNSVSLSICSKKMFDDLSKYGVVPRKTFVSFIPVVQEEFQRHLLRGIFDGDGYLGKRLAVLTSGSEKMSEDYFGIGKSLDCKVLIYKEGNKYRLIVTKGSRKLINYMYENCNIVLTRKYQSYLKFWKLREVEDKKPLR